jgi:lipoprotein NlpD
MGKLAGRSASGVAPWLSALAALALSGCPGPGPDPAGSKQHVELSGIWHELQQGDRLDKLARRYDIPLQDIEEINGLERWEKLEPGRKIFIPGAARGAGEGGKGSGKARAAGKGSSPPATMQAAAPRPAGSFVFPVPSGKVTSRFGVRSKRRHEGIDIAAPAGTAVLAAAGGKVIYAGSGVRGYGNLILIRHQGGIVTVYAHNRRNLVKEGEEVGQGQVIAEVGHTGRASGDHLHFEVRRGDTPVDPSGFVSRQRSR